MAQTETIQQPFKYAGQVGIQAEGNNLYYMRARYYDANLGRFISEDPAGFADGLNLYAYVGGNPIMLVDPSGLGREGPGWGDVALATGLIAGDLLLGGPTGEGIGPALAILGVKSFGKGAIEGAVSQGARTEAATLAEQLTLKEAQAGAGQGIMQGKINDPRFPADQWAKIQHVHTTPEGQNIVVHYWERLADSLRTGFKFKN